MKCPICNAWSRVINNRGAVTRESIKRRRLCGNEHKFWTLEVFPGFVNPEAAKRCLIGVENSRKRWARDQLIRKDKRPNREIATAFNLHIDHVRKIKRK